MGVTRQAIIGFEQGKYLQFLEAVFLIAAAGDTPLGEVFSYFAEPGA